MLRRIQSVFSARAPYRPFPAIRPADAVPAAEAPRDPARALADELERWAEVLAHPLTGDPAFKRYTVAQCLRAVLRALDGQGESDTRSQISSVLRSVHLLRAVTRVSDRLGEATARFAEDIQISYVAALHSAAQCGHLDSSCVLNLLVGTAGRVQHDSPVVVTSYAYSLIKHPEISDRHAQAFCGAVDYAVCQRTERDGVARVVWRMNLFRQKGYGSHKQQQLLFCRRAGRLERGALSLAAQAGPTRPAAQLARSGVEAEPPRNLAARGVRRDPAPAARSVGGSVAGGTVRQIRMDTHSA